MNKLKRVLFDNRGFTLIELLAVVVIIAILMAIALPSINAILYNSRSEIYAQDAVAYVDATKNLVMDQTYTIDDFDTTYYIHINNLDDSDLGPSPFAEWEDAYVAVILNEDGSKEYYWVSVDKAGWRIDLTKDKSIDKSDVYNGKKTVNFRQPIGNRSKIIVYDKDGNMKSLPPYYEVTREQLEKCYSFRDVNDSEVMLTYYWKKERPDECGSEVVIPATVDGKEVTSIYQYAFNSMGIEYVYIPETVKSIGARAFFGNQIVSLNIPSSVTSIGNEAFASNNLSNLILAEGLTTIGAQAFRNNNLTEAIVPDSVTSLGACSYCDNPIPNSSFLYVKNGDAIDYSKVRGYIGNLEEFGTSKIFEIPATTEGVALTRIENSAFSSMSLSGWEVIIPSTVTYIGSSAFNGSGIRKVNIPNGVTYIGSSAFYSNQLAELSIPSSVTSIGTIAFNNNQVLNQDDAWIYKRTTSGIDYSTIIGYAGKKRDSIIIPSTKNGVALKTIDNQAFYVSYFTGKLTLPSTVTTIGSLAFGLNNVSSIDNGDGIEIPGGFIYGRKADGSVDNTVILSYASMGGTVTVPSTVKTISSSAFYYTGITGVTLPEGLKKIGGSAFHKCKLSGEVVIPSTVTEIGSNAFRKEIIYTNYNSDLVRIVNKAKDESGNLRVFDWKSITGGPSDATFATGTVENWYGNIEVVAG